MTVGKIVGNNKGMTLVTVIVVLMVATILASILIETALYNYILAKSGGYADYSYYAAESAIQQCFDMLNNKCANPCLADANNIVYDGVDGQFAKTIVKDVLAPYVDELSLGGVFNGIDVLDDPDGEAADVNIRINYLGCYRETDHPGKIRVKIGMTARSILAVRPYLSGGKEVYAIKDFYVTIPNSFKLKGPVYTIGDLMADRNSEVDILGDVHVYGTSPEYLKQPEQYYYGGIYARSDSQIEIRGNAYCRSFIRTGKYSETPDASSIYIYKDAVAQCIQIFGKGQRIGVWRNAYTFDDMEINGEDSVIAVNGSYFGLSDGSDGIYHDNSSAIINSATLHHFNSEASRKSRIVINGAVVLNGGTFRIDEESGDTLYQIEDASLAWFTDPLDFGPVYRRAPIPLPPGQTYVEWLKDYNYHLTANGYNNLFQIFPMQEFWDMDMAGDPESETVKNAFSQFFSDIDDMRAPGDSNSGINPLIAPKIQGFTNYVLAANESMYFMEKDNEEEAGVSRATVLADNFQVENIEAPYGMNWNTFWNKYVDSGYEGYDSYGWNSGYCTDIPWILNETLKPKLIYQTQVFSRKDDAGLSVKSGNEAVVHLDTNIFGTLQESLGGIISSSPFNPYIVLPADGNLNNPGYPFNDPDPASVYADKYFLIVNTDPEKDLILDNININGIIFTAGKVVFKNNASVNGAVIAAGRGYDTDSGIAGSAAESGTVNGVAVMTRIPRIDKNGGNLMFLDNGSYAAIYCEGPGSDIKIHFPDPDPDLGREMLLDIFLNQDFNYPINLYNVF